MKKMSLILPTAALAAAVTLGAAVSQAKNVAGCNLIPHKGYRAAAEITCSDNEHTLILQSCAQTRTSRGWVLMQNSCDKVGYRGDDADAVSTSGVWLPSLHPRPGQEIRTWAWANVNGHTGTATSNSFHYLPAVDYR